MITEQTHQRPLRATFPAPTGVLAEAGIEPADALEAALPDEFRERLMGSITNLLRSPAVTDGVDSRAILLQFADSALPGLPLSPDEYGEWLARDVVRHGVNMASPLALGHMTGWQPAWVRVLGEVVLALNQNLVKHEASRSFSLLERQTLAMLHRLVFGMPESFYEEHVQQPASTLGIMAAGSTVANITALWIARNLALTGPDGNDGPEEIGLAEALQRRGCRGAVFLGSRLMHYSVQKAASLLGLGAGQVVELPVDRAYRVDLRAAREALVRCQGEGRRVLALIGTAGTTDCGSVDPLAGLADLAGEHSVHFHVDAAWGTPLLFSRKHRARLTGIERADSVTLDGHKQLHLPAGSNLLLLRDPGAARAVEKEAHYMLHQESGDLGRRSLEGSRPASALYLHAALHLVGQAGYEVLIDRRIEAAQSMAGRIRQRPDFQMLADTETNLIVYRYLPPSFRAAAHNGGTSEADLGLINDFNVRLQRVQSATGRTFVSRTTLFDTRQHPGRPVVALRAVITHPATGESEVDQVLDDQARIGAQLARNGTPVA